jgi:predicted DNA-binding protein (UPF0251 family)
MRPEKARNIAQAPDLCWFKPVSRPGRGETIILLEDEYEAIRLHLYQQLYQETAAARMGISRQTFGRILKRAQYKLADALLHRKILQIGNGRCLEAVNTPQQEMEPAK